MVREEFYFKSCDRENNVHAVRWIPEGKPVAILQICHGMTEHILRYDRFAAFLAENGFYVTGHDHLGHGKTARDKEDLGYFDKKRGNEYLIADIHRLRGMTQERLPGVPYFILGHSMGSFLVRQYLCLHGEGLFGAVIMGTGSYPLSVLATGRMLCKALSLVKGWHYRSKQLQKMSFKGYNSAFEPVRTPCDWLTREEGIVDRYLEDPLCGFCFTVSAYNQMFRGIQFVHAKENVDRMPKRLPVFFVSGGEDPVGGENGAGVRKVYEMFHEAGMLDVLIKIYPGARHEILNELNYRDVQDDLLAWMLSRMSMDA